MRSSDWSSDVCSSDLQRRRKSIGANAISMATSASRKQLFRHRSALPQWRPVIAAANLGAMTEAEFLAALRTLPLHDRKSVVKGKSVSARVDLGGRRIIKKTKTNTQQINITI